MKQHETFTDLAPMIIRRRLIIEAIIDHRFINSQILNDYMILLSKTMNMTIVTDPIFNYLEEYGWSAYMSWKESGMHVYSWSETEKRPSFMSIDIYTCKDFDLEEVIEFTKDELKNSISEITWRE